MSTFSEMVSGISDNIDNLTFQIGKIDDQMTDLQLQITDIKTEVLSAAVTASNAYLEYKSLELSAAYGVPMSVCTSGSYGKMIYIDDNITDWGITSGGVPCSGPLFFTPSMLAPSSTGADLDQYNRQVNYLVVLDHLYRDFQEPNPDYPPGDEYLPVATYGIQANYEGLQTGKEILERDKSKYEVLKVIYEGYV